MLKARDIMARALITVPPDMTIEDLGRLFIEKNISGAPVLDSGGKLYGIVTENDLITRAAGCISPQYCDSLMPLFPSEAAGLKLRSGRWLHRPSV